MKKNRMNLSIILINIALSMLVIYINPRFDILTFLSLIIVNALIYFLLKLKDRKVENNIRKKIESIFQLLHSLDPNNYNYEIKDDEFGKLRDEIVKVISENKLLTASTQKNQEVIREYTEDIAHQIKTPLTGALLMLDLMEEESKDLNKYIVYMRNSMNRLHELVDALLKLASLDSGIINMKRERVNAKSMLTKIVKELEIYFKDMKLEIPIFGDSFDLICDKKWTYEAFFNIIKNALESSPVKGIEIYTKETNIYKSIIVKDFSEGLSNEQLKKVYKRFYTENSESSGFGIGLPMAKSIMEKQDGELLYYNGKDSNSFELRFYK